MVAGHWAVEHVDVWHIVYTVCRNAGTGLVTSSDTEVPLLSYKVVRSGLNIYGIQECCSERPLKIIIRPLIHINIIITTPKQVQ